METFSDGPNEWRGGDGPMMINRARAEHKLYEAFLHAGTEAGHEVTADHNGYRQDTRSPRGLDQLRRLTRRPAHAAGAGAENEVVISHRWLSFGEVRLGQLWPLHGR
jgi:hypothetical protein